MDSINRNDFKELTYLLSYLSIGGEDDIADYIESRPLENITKAIDEIEQILNDDYSDQAVIEYLKLCAVNHILANDRDWHGWTGKDNLVYLVTELKKQLLNKC